MDIKNEVVSCAMGDTTADALSKAATQMLDYLRQYCFTIKDKSAAVCCKKFVGKNGQWYEDIVDRVTENTPKRKLNKTELKNMYKAIMKEFATSDSGDCLILSGRVENKEEKKIVGPLLEAAKAYQLEAKVNRLNSNIVQFTLTKSPSLPDLLKRLRDSGGENEKYLVIPPKNHELCVSPLEDPKGNQVQTTPSDANMANYTKVQTTFNTTTTPTPTSTTTLPTTIPITNPNTATNPTTTCTTIPTTNTTKILTNPTTTTPTTTSTTTSTTQPTTNPTTTPTNSTTTNPTTTPTNSTKINTTIPPTTSPTTSTTTTLTTNSTTTPTNYTTTTHTTTSTTPPTTNPTSATTNPTTTPTNYTTTTPTTTSTTPPTTNPTSAPTTASNPTTSTTTPTNSPTRTPTINSTSTPTTSTTTPTTTPTKLTINPTTSTTAPTTSPTTNPTINLTTSTTTPTISPTKPTINPTTSTSTPTTNFTISTTTTTTTATASITSNTNVTPITTKAETVILHRCVQFKLKIMDVDFPSKVLTDKQISLVEEALLDRILENKDRHFSPSYLNSCNEAGYLVVGCKNLGTFKWTKSQVPNLKPWPNAVLRAQHYCCLSDEELLDGDRGKNQLSPDKRKALCRARLEANGIKATPKEQDSVSHADEVKTEPGYRLSSSQDVTRPKLTRSQKKQAMKEKLLMMGEEWDPKKWHPSIRNKKKRKKVVQQQEKEEETTFQKRVAQPQEKEEETPFQKRVAQLQEKEEETPFQKRVVQQQEKEEEAPFQKRVVQQQKKEEETPFQKRVVQQQEKEEETPFQKRVVQQPEKEEETPFEFHEASQSSEKSMNVTSKQEEEIRMKRKKLTMAERRQKIQEKLLLRGEQWDPAKWRRNKKKHRSKLDIEPY